MKIDFDKHIFKKYLYLTISLCMVIVFYKVIDDLSGIGNSLSSFFSFLKVAFLPIFLGFVYAYFLYRPVRWIERNILSLKFMKLKDKHKRFIATIMVFTIVLYLIYLLIYAIIPNIFSSVQNLISQAPTTFENIEILFADINEDPTGNYILTSLGIDNNSLTEYLETLDYESLLEGTLNNMKNISSIAFSTVYQIVSLFLNIILSIFIGIYVILDFENIFNTISRFLKVLLPDTIYKNTARLLTIVDGIFYDYFVGKMLCSIIIGILCYIGMLVIRTEYATLISLIVGITNMIPYFGPIIGGIPGILLTIIQSPLQALLVLIWIIIIQQFDGNILGPNVLGKVVKLNPFWIIFAITLGGKFFGIFGMFLAVPVFAVFKVILNEWVLKKENKLFGEKK